MAYRKLSTLVLVRKEEQHCAFLLIHIIQTFFFFNGQKDKVLILTELMF